MSNYMFRVYLILMNCLLIWSCDQGQVEIDCSCLDYSSNCVSFTVPYFCDSFIQGFYRNFSYKCSACSRNCQVYRAFSCSTFLPKFYKSGSNFQAFPTYCATYTSNTVCQTCVDHYFIIGAICSVCDTTCKACLGTSSTCTSCEVGKDLQIHNFFLAHPHALLASTIHIFVIDINQTAINFQCVCNDFILMDQINVKFVKQHAQSVKIMNMQYKCECSYVYFQVDSQTCQECVILSQICVQNENHCLFCVDSNSIVNNSFLCLCKKCWILDTDGITCIKSQLPCLDFAITINNCVTCKDQIHQQAESCQCESGWIFEDNYFCITFQQPCKTCEIINNRCLTCLDTNYELYNISQFVCNSLIILIVSLHVQSFKNHVMNAILMDLSTAQIQIKSQYLQQSVLCLKCQIPCSTCIKSVNEFVTCADPNQIINHRLQMFMQRRVCEQDCQGIYNCNNCNNCIKRFYLSNVNKCLKFIDHSDVCYNQIIVKFVKRNTFLMNLDYVRHILLLVIFVAIHLVVMYVQMDITY
ncbi:unnamed protein product [Paramecium pentaurelia]|uniref:Transmembrane protein n=1 Tax=Paramecium pentaurelia TaxID=43138 RepID=A0A8S1UR25_9CILI|nr:unnamed protein product [Paramecium pentaurelia]